MVDFKKRLKNKNIERKIHPVEIYESLDRRSEAGPLRGTQKEILEEWNDKRRNERDVVVKLHTGEGKTLIGLLLLQSKLNETGEPALYLCPNIYLANQVRLEARKFGIPFCEIGSDGEIPEEFQTGKSILICHVQKLFNGKTKFGLNNKSIPAGAVVLDDSHACIDAIRNSLTIRIKRDHELYASFIRLFGDDLREQGEGTFLEIEQGSYNSMLPVPYWSWVDRRDEVLGILIGGKECSEIAFAWELIKDNLENCQAFISGSYLEISPILPPIHEFGTFSRAGQRILMSATTQDDSFAIKGLGFEVGAIRDPLTSKSLKWSGEKMIILPSLIDVGLDRDRIVNWLSTARNSGYGVVFLTPDFRNRSAYERAGVVFAEASTIFDCVQRLKFGDYSVPYAFANRYDGVDLPDDACRVLVIDSKPYFDSLLDRYEEECRVSSDIINVKVAQKIEQGLGRSVRGEKDYSVIIITGGDVTKFVKSKVTNKYFSPQTQKQIEIGLQIAEFSKEELENNPDPYSVLVSLIEQSLRRDEGWKEFYIEEMQKIDENSQQPALHEVLQLEYQAESAFAVGRVDAACEIMQRLCDKFNHLPAEKGWYVQQLARYQYKGSKTDSDRTQHAAFALNTQLMKPRTGAKYKKINYINEGRLSRIRNWLSAFNSFEELQLAVTSLTENLSFGVSSEKFERAFKELGDALGFVTQRPDKDIKKGPDVLWCVNQNSYFLIECKSEVDEGRAEISKYEAGQMNSHCGWFEENYGEAECLRLLVIPTHYLSYEANFTHDVKIVRKSSLRRLKEAFRSFIYELKSYEILNITDEKLHQLIEYHGLAEQSLKHSYHEALKKSKDGLK